MASNKNKTSISNQATPTIKANSTSPETDSALNSSESSQNTHFYNFYSNSSVQKIKSKYSQIREKLFRRHSSSNDDQLIRWTDGKPFSDLEDFPEFPNNHGQQFWQLLQVTRVAFWSVCLDDSTCVSCDQNICQCQTLQEVKNDNVPRLSIENDQSLNSLSQTSVPRQESNQAEDTNKVVHKRSYWLLGKKLNTFLLLALSLTLLELLALNDIQPFCPLCALSQHYFRLISAYILFIFVPSLLLAGYALAVSRLSWPLKKSRRYSLLLLACTDYCIARLAFACAAASKTSPMPFNHLDDENCWFVGLNSTPDLTSHNISFAVHCEGGWQLLFACFLRLFYTLGRTSLPSTSKDLCSQNPTSITVSPQQTLQSAQSDPKLPDRQQKAYHLQQRMNNLNVISALLYILLPINESLLTYGRLRQSLDEALDERYSKHSSRQRYFFNHMFERNSFLLTNLTVLSVLFAVFCLSVAFSGLIICWLEVRPSGCRRQKMLHLPFLNLHRRRLLPSLLRSRWPSLWFDRLFSFGILILVGGGSPCDWLLFSMHTCIAIFLTRRKEKLLRLANEHHYKVWCRLRPNFLYPF